MFSIRTVLVCLGLLAHLTRLGAADRVFLFAGSDQIPVLNAADLTPSGSIAFPSAAFKVLTTTDGGKLYVVRAHSIDTIAVVDPITLNVTKTIGLGVSASDAVVTPDGKYLLVAAGRLRVISTQTDEEVIQPIPTGTAPTQVLVNNFSTRAYVLSSSGRSLHIINLEDLTILNGVTGNAVGTLSSIALSDDDSRLVGAETNGLRQFSATDLSLLSTTPWGTLTMVRGRVVLAPGSKYALVENGGSPPNVTSVLVNLNDRQIRPLGDIGVTRLSQLTAVNETTAYALVSDNGLVRIDFSDPAAITLTPLVPGLAANTLSLSPNRRFLYASSPSSSRVNRVELETATVTHSVVANVAPASHAILFEPVAGPPARLVIHGGDNQSAGPGRMLPVQLSIRALSADGSPIVGQQILFSAAGGTPLQFEPGDLVTTNQRGIASVRVTIPTLAAINAAKAALEAPAKVALTSDAPPSSEQTTEPDPVQRVAVSASAGGVTAVGFTVNIVTQVGLVKLSGDHQIASLGMPFPLPMVMLATDKNGDPLPVGTPIDILVPGAYAACESPAEVDASGIASTQCVSTLAGSNQNAVRFGFVLADATVAVPELDRAIAQENFSYNIGINPKLSVEKVSGDQQTAASGTKLPQPLRFRVNNTSGIQIIGQGGIGVNVRQISGPPVTVEPRFLVVSPGADSTVAVTLGPAAGTAVIEVQASAPGLPSGRFTVTSTGGQPQRLEKLGDNQSGRVGGELPNPLEVRVFNESNQLVSFPQVTWTVLEGDASIVPATNAESGSARVLLGSTPGTIRIQARAGSLVTTFVVEATLAQPVSISTVAGVGQTLTSGVLSEPLMVLVNEVNNRPAAGVPVTFSGPPNVVLHALQGEESGNPLQQVTNSSGQAGVRVELVASAALTASPGQFSSTVTITASAGDNLSTFFVLEVLGRKPAFAVEGVLNAASFQPGVVPGSLVTIFGSGLSEGISGTVFVGGETSFGGTNVRIGNFQAPLISITGPPNEQINVQVPFELSAGIQTTVEVQNNGANTPITGVASFASQPGIFNVALDESTTVGAVIHADTGELVTPDNPAARGEVVSMFITGGGPVTPDILSGVPAPPGLPPVMVLPVIVGVDNKGSDILFSGYAPGFIGLYQINFAIPLDATCGLVPLNVRVGTVVSPVTNTAVLCPQ